MTQGPEEDVTGGEDLTGVEPVDYPDTPEQDNDEPVDAAEASQDDAGA